MGFGGYSITAALRVEQKLSEGGLVKVCHSWDVTHDIGECDEKR